MTGTILKSLSGFYYVLTGEQGTVTCRARGKFRHLHITPLVGDRVEITLLPDGTGMVDAILPRRNAFSRPAVANIDQLVIVASGAPPVTDPFLIDRAAALAESRGCEPVVVFNKCDLDGAEELFDLYRSAGFTTLHTSAAAGTGIEDLRTVLDGKVSAFTGNTGVGKSSLLNALQPGLALAVGEVSDKLGRGRHTTRHVELLRLDSGGIIADTPGFSSLESDPAELGPKEDLAAAFREFRPYLEDCRFIGCAHVKEKGCAVRAAVKAGEIAKSRHQSYVRLYEQAKEVKDWEKQQNV